MILGNAIFYLPKGGCKTSNSAMPEDAINFPVASRGSQKSASLLSTLLAISQRLCLQTLAT